MKNPTAAIAAFAASLVLLPSAAHADRVPVDDGGDSAPCVTYAEYHAAEDAFVSRAVTRGQVRRMFDTDGHRGGARVLDGLVDQVPVDPQHEVVVPRHRMVRHYVGCVDAISPNGADVFVEFNTRTDHVTSLAYL